MSEVPLYLLGTIRQQEEGLDDDNSDDEAVTPHP